MGVYFFQKGFLHEVEIGEKVLVAATAILLLHGEDDCAALSVESMVL